MKNKLKSLLVIGMMLATVLPLTALGTATESAPVTAGLFDRTTVRGFVLYLGMSKTGQTFHYFALRLHYITVELSGERSTGVIRMRPVDIPAKLNGFHGHTYIFASFRGTLNV